MMRPLEQRKGEEALPPTLAPVSPVSSPWGGGGGEEAAKKGEQPHSLALWVVPVCFLKAP